MAVSPTIVLILLQRRTSLGMGLTLGIIGPLEPSVVNKPV